MPGGCVKKIVVGLGNPGSRYQKTRHNIGWLVLDRLADRMSVGGRAKSRDAAASVHGRLGDDEVVLVKPMTYMNDSGIAVRKALARERVPMVDLLVVVDDMALPFGRLRLRERGSAGGHNGLRSIIGEMGTEDFARLRVGIGAASGDAITHVLGDFEHAEQRHLDAVLDAAAEAVEAWLRLGANRAANQWNAWQLDVEEPTGATRPAPDRATPGRAGGPGSPGTAPGPAAPGTATPHVAAPTPDGIVRTATGWRRLLPGRGRSRDAAK
jgi:peptidyl-tRNA hydrolase, PTH1 family